jgi:hypothetical protein
VSPTVINAVMDTSAAATPPPEPEAEEGISAGATAPVSITVDGTKLHVGSLLSYAQTIIDQPLLAHRDYDKEKANQFATEFLKHMQPYLLVDNFRTDWCDTSFFGLRIIQRDVENSDTKEVDKSDRKKSSKKKRIFIGPLIVFKDSTNNQIGIYTVCNRKNVMVIKRFIKFEDFLNLLDTSNEPSEGRDETEQVIQAMIKDNHHFIVEDELFEKELEKIRVSKDISTCEVVAVKFNGKTELRHPYAAVIKKVADSILPPLFVVTREKVNTHEDYDENTKKRVNGVIFKLCRLTVGRLHDFVKQVEEYGSCGKRMNAIFDTRRVTNHFMWASANKRKGKKSVAFDTIVSSLVGELSRSVYKIFRVSGSCPVFKTSGKSWTFCRDSRGQRALARVVGKKSKRLDLESDVSDEHGRCELDSFTFRSINEVEEDEESSDDEDSGCDKPVGGRVQYDPIILNDSGHFFSLLFEELCDFASGKITWIFDRLPDEMSNKSESWDAAEAGNVIHAVSTCIKLIGKCYKIISRDKSSIREFRFVPDFLSDIIPRTPKFKQFREHLIFLCHYFPECVYTTDGMSNVQLRRLQFLDHTENLIPIDVPPAAELSTACKEFCAQFGIRCQEFEVVRKATQFILSGDFHAVMSKTMQKQSKKSSTKVVARPKFVPADVGALVDGECSVLDGNPGSSKLSKSAKPNQERGSKTGQSSDPPSAPAQSRNLTGVDASSIIEGKREQKRAKFLNLSTLSTMKRRVDEVSGLDIPIVKKFLCGDGGGSDSPPVVCAPDPTSLDGVAGHKAVQLINVAPIDFIYVKSVDGGSFGSFSEILENKCEEESPDARPFIEISPHNSNWKFANVWVESMLILESNSMNSGRRRKVGYAFSNDSLSVFIFNIGKDYRTSHRALPAKVERKSTLSVVFSVDASDEGLTSGRDPHSGHSRASGHQVATVSPEKDRSMDIAVSESSDHSKDWTILKNAAVNDETEGLAPMPDEDVDVIGQSHYLLSYCGEGIDVSEFRDTFFFALPNDVVIKSMDDIERMLKDERGIHRGRRKASQNATGGASTGRSNDDYDDEDMEASDNDDDEKDFDFAGGDERTTRDGCKKKSIEQTPVKENLDTIMKFTKERGYICVNPVVKIGVIFDRAARQVLVIPTEKLVTSQACQCVCEFLRCCRVEDKKILGPYFIQFNGDVGNLQCLSNMFMNEVLGRAFDADDYKVYTTSQSPQDGKSSSSLVDTECTLCNFIMSPDITDFEPCDVRFHTLAQSCPNTKMQESCRTPLCKHELCNFVQPNMDPLSFSPVTLQSLMHKHAQQEPFLLPPALVTIRSPLCHCLFNKTLKREYLIRLMCNDDSFCKFINQKNGNNAVHIFGIQMKDGREFAYAAKLEQKSTERRTYTHTETTAGGDSDDVVD